MRVAPRAVVRPRRADAKLFAVAVATAGYANEWGTCGSDCEGVGGERRGKSIRDTDNHLTFLAALVAFEAARPVDGSSPPVDATPSCTSRVSAWDV